MATGLEVIGVVSGVATLVGVSAKLSYHLSMFVERARDADTTAKDLHAKIEQLRVCAQTVKETWLHRRQQSRPERAEIEFWRRIDRSLRQCGVILEKFEKALEELRGGRTEWNWLQKALLQFKLDCRDPQIMRLESKIDTHLRTLEISILCVQNLKAIIDHNEIKSILAAQTKTLERLDQMIQNGRNHVEVTRRETANLRAHEAQQASRSSFFDDDSIISAGEDALRSDDPEKEMDEIENMEKVIEVAASVRARSVYEPDAESVRSPLLDADRDSFISGYSSTFSLRLGQGIYNVSGDGLRPDSTPDFDDTMPRELLEALIKRLKTQVDHDLLAGHYHQAEENQREAIRHLEELQAGYDVPFKDFNAMQTKLAHIHIEQDREEEAAELLHDLFEGKLKPREIEVVKASSTVDPSVDQADAKPYYYLALTYYRRYGREKRTQFLDAAEKYAWRAFKCSFEARDSQDSTFLDSVKLLIGIYEDRNKMLHARTFRELYLQQPEVSHRPPSSRSSNPSTITRQIPPAVRSSLSVDTVLSGNSSSTPSDLISAIAAGREDVVDDLLQQDTDVEMSCNGKTALMYAVDKDNEKIIRKLHHAGAQLEQALFYAVRKGNPNMTRLLLSLDAEKETRDPSGLTPLLVAAKCKHASVVRELLDKGVDVDAQDREGWTAVHYVALSGSAELMRILLEPRARGKSVNINATCSAGKTALHLLAELGKVPIAEVLFEHEADPELKDNARRTPLYLAVKNRRYEFVRMLLEREVIVEPETLPPTSQEIRNLLPQPQPAAPQRRGSSSTTTSRQSSHSILSALKGKGLRRKRPSVDG